MKTLPYLLLILPCLLGAQSGFVLPQTANSRNLDLAVSPLGDRIVIGEVFYRGEPSIDLDPGTEEYRFPALGDNAGFGTFVASYSPAGELNFAFPISDPEQAYNNVQAFFVDTDADGNIYVQGQYYGQADFDPSEEVYRLSAAAANQDRNFIASYSSTGELRFAIDMPEHNPGKSDLVNYRQFGVDDAGNSYATLYVTEAFDYDNGNGEFIPEKGRSVIVSYDSEGRFRFGFPTLRSPHILGVAPTGEFYAAGTFNAQDVGFDLDPGEGTFAPAYTVDSIRTVLLAFNREGNLNFGHGFAGAALFPDFVGGDKEGNVYLTGTIFPDTLDVAPGQATHLLGAPADKGMQPDIFVIKYTAAGEVVRALALEDRGEFPAFDYLFDHALTDDGELYLSGFISDGTVDFDPGDDGEVLVEGAGDELQRSFVAAYDADLNLKFAYSIAGTDDDASEPAGPLLQIAPTSDCGDYALLGNVRLPQTIDYGTGEASYVPQPAAPTEDSLGLLLLTAYAPGNSTVDASCSPLSAVPDRRTVEMDLRAVPNPSGDGRFTVELPYVGDRDITYRVTDLAGRTVLSGRTTSGAGALGGMPIDLSGRNPGVYFLRVATGDFRSTTRLVVGR